MQWMIRYTSSMFSGKMGQSFQFTEVTTPCLNCRWLYSSISTRFCTSVWPTVFIYFVTAGRVEPIQYPGYVTSVISCLASYHLSCNSTSHSLITSFVFLCDANQYLKLGNKKWWSQCVLLNYSHWAPANTYPFLSTKGVFSSFRPTVYKYQVTENASFQNESFQNALQRGDARGQKKTQVFDLSDVRSRSIGSWMMSYIIYYVCSVRNPIEIPPFNCFPVYGRKRSTCFLWTRVFFFLQNWRNIWIRLDGTWKSFQAHVAL